MGNGGSLESAGSREALDSKTVGKVFSRSGIVKALKRGLPEIKGQYHASTYVSGPVRLSRGL
jgi:hypothetical protein